MYGGNNVQASKNGCCSEHLPVNVGIRYVVVTVGLPWFLFEACWYSQVIPLVEC